MVTFSSHVGNHQFQPCLSGVQDTRGNWAFLKASTTPYCKSEMLRLLHEASADVRVADRSGRTALHAASSCDEGDQWLLKSCWLMIKKGIILSKIFRIITIHFGNPF